MVGITMHYLYDEFDDVKSLIRIYFPPCFKHVFNFTTNIITVLHSLSAIILFCSLYVAIHYQLLVDLHFPNIIIQIYCFHA